jgi:DNA-binding transcriptional MerR regulator
MIGRQLDLFGGAPKPPKNIVIEDEPVVQEPEILAPEPLIPELDTADAEPENMAGPVLEGAGVHVQLPSVDYEEPFFLEEESPFAADKGMEVFKLNESLEDYTLEEAIAAELVADALPENKWETGDNNVVESGVEKKEDAPLEWDSELPGSEPAKEETDLEESEPEEPEPEEPGLEEPGLEDPVVEEPEPDEPELEEPVIEEPEPEEPELEEPVLEEPEPEESEPEEPAMEEPAAAFLQAETASEAGEALLQDEALTQVATVSEPEGQEPFDAAVEIIADEPDRVTGEEQDSEPSLAQLERLDEIPEESFEKLMLKPEPEQVEEIHEPFPEVLAISLEAEVHDGIEVGPLNIPSDQALYSRQYYTMRETANMFNVNQSLLRYWENEFDILKPKKNRKGDRYFRPDDIKNLELIYHLLRVRKFTISGAKDYLKNKAKSLDTFVMVQRLEKLKLFLQEIKVHA